MAMRINVLRSPKELSGAGQASASLKLLEKKVGRPIAPLLPESMAQNEAYWQRVHLRVEDRSLDDRPQISLIPSILLPIFKRMNQQPFDILVSIPRSGDPLAYTLLEMSKRVEGLGFPAMGLPEHESFGGGRSPSIINCSYFSKADLDRELTAGEKENYIKLIDGLEENERQLFLQDPYHCTADQYAHLLSDMERDLGSVVRWFMVNHSPSFIRAARPILAEIIKDTSLAQKFSKINNILIVDDCTNDLDAYHSVEYPLSILAPHTNREIGLLSGTIYDVQEIGAICGDFRATWSVMEDGNWVGPKASPSHEMGEKTIRLMGIKENLNVSHVKDYALKEVFAYLTREVLYENGLIFARGASWIRQETEQKYIRKYGEKEFRSWREYMLKDLTPGYLAGLFANSSIFASMYRAIEELREGMDSLFGDEINQILLKAYLESPLDFKELRPISDLFFLMVRQEELS